MSLSAGENAREEKSCTDYTYVACLLCTGVKEAAV